MRQNSPFTGILSKEDPATLGACARLLLDKHFTPTLAELICAAVDLDVTGPGLAGTAAPGRLLPRQRRRGFAEEVLRAYA